MFSCPRHLRGILFLSSDADEDGETPIEGYFDVILCASGDVPMVATITVSRDGQELFTLGGAIRSTPVTESLPGDRPPVAEYSTSDSAGS